MRYWIGLILLLALVGSPVRVVAQDEEQDRLEEFYPATLPEADFDKERQDAFYPEDARLEPKPADGPPGRMARNTLIASSVLFGVGVPMIGGGVFSLQNYESQSTSLSSIDLGPGPGLILAGSFFAVPGLIGMLVAGPLLAKAKREQREKQQANHQTLRRVRWDVARSRLVF